MRSKFHAYADNPQLWFARISDTSLNAEQSTERLLSITEKERLESTGSANKRREYLLSRALMRHALSQHFLRPESEWIFIERPDLPPLVDNLPENIRFSLSHSKDIICFAISNGPIGVDIEATDKKRDFLNLAKNVMHDDDVSLLPQNKLLLADHFYRVWCAKEAYYKALPSSEQSTTAMDEFRFKKLVEGHENWILIEAKIERFRLALVLKNNPEEVNCHHFMSVSGSTEITWQGSNYAHHHW